MLLSHYILIWSSGRIAPRMFAPVPQRRWAFALLAMLLTLLAATPAFAVSHAGHLKLRHHGRKLVRYAFPSGHYQVGLNRWTPLFPGSHEMLVRENEELDRLQLPRIADEYELLQYEASQELVAVPETEALKFAPDLPENRRYCRPWTRDFLQDFSEAYYQQFGTPIQINSLVRTVEQQRHLRRWNHYAAPEAGDTASTHLTGVTFDMSRRGLTFGQYEWIREYLLPLQMQGMVDPIEERQPVLHVVVYDKYSGGSAQKNAWSEANEPTEMNPYGSAATPTMVNVTSTGGAIGGGSEP